MSHSSRFPDKLHPATAFTGRKKERERHFCGMIKEVRVLFLEVFGGQLIFDASFGKKMEISTPAKQNKFE